MDRINNATFIKEVAHETGYSHEDIREVLVAAEKVIASYLKEGIAVKALPSITFTPSMRSARVGRNPKTGESVDVPAMRSVKAKIAASLKDAIQ